MASSPLPGSAPRPWRWLVTTALLTGLVAIGAPLIRDTALRSRAQRTADELRRFAAAFQADAARRGDWAPGDGTPAALPSGFKPPSLPGWTTPSPIGGHYAWEPNSLHQGSRHRAAIVIASTPDTRVTPDLRQLLALDRALDDGDLTSGNFLLGHRNFPLLVLEH